MGLMHNDEGTPALLFSVTVRVVCVNPLDMSDVLGDLLKLLPVQFCCLVFTRAM